MKADLLELIGCLSVVILSILIVVLGYLIGAYIQNLMR